MNHNGNEATLLFCVIPAIAPYRVYYDSRREFSFNNVNYAKAMWCKMLRLFFYDSER